MAKGSVEGRAKRRLTVTDQSVISTWDNGKGGETTLYEITAVDENGAPVRGEAAELRGVGGGRPDRVRDRALQP
jgi:hypothetical protein